MFYIYSTVGRSIADIYDPSAEVNMPSRSYIEAMDRPTVLYILYTMVSAQQTNLCLQMLREMTPFSPKKDYATTSQYLSSYGCAITMIYIAIAIL